MAPITAPPLKILTDLGYEIWELETVEDILDALKRTINELTRINENDGRIPILIEALTAIRGKRKKESPSRGMKATEKRTTLKGSKFIPKAKPTPKPRANPVALLPPAQEDNQPIFSTLLNGLKNIASLLKNISALLGIQFIFKKALAARKRIADALALKREREKGLEGDDQAGLGKKIKETITKPIKSFWDKLLNFFKNIILGSAVLGFYKWMKDPKNQETIKGISDWLQKNGEGVLKGILAILTLGIGYRIFRIVSRVGKAIGKLARVAGGLIKGGSRLIKKLIDLLTRGGATALGTRKGFKFLLKGTTGARNLIGGAKNLIKSLPSKKIPLLGESLEQLPILNRFRAEAGADALMEVIKGRNISDAIRDAGIKSIQKPSTIKAEKIASQKILEEFLTKNPGAKGAGKLAKDLKKFKPTKVGSKGSEELLKNILRGKGGTIPLNPRDVGTAFGGDILKGVNPLEEALKQAGSDPKLLQSKVGSKIAEDFVPAATTEVTDKLPNFGKKLLGAGSKKLTTNAALKGTLKNVARGLPLLGTYLDTVSAIEEIKKGNFYAAGLFGVGAITSIIPGMQGVSLAASIGGIGASIVEDKINTPNLSMNKKKRNVNVVLAPTDTGDSSNSGSGATSSDVEVVRSFDSGNNNFFQVKQTVGAL